MFGFGNVCERCGRKGLDDLGYTDCDVSANDAPESARTSFSAASA